MPNCAVLSCKNYLNKAGLINRKIFFHRVSEALIYGAWMLAEALSFAPNFASARRAGARVLANIRDADVGGSGEHEEGGGEEWHSTGNINLSSVTFGYPSDSQPLLRDLSLSCPAGHSIAPVGHSGSGKSTVLQLLLGLYKPGTGKIELDGKDINKDLTRKQVRRQMALVQQEPVLFERTIRENIAYGDNEREIPMEEIIEAAKQAHVHSFIASLPLGYETRAGGNGAQLSGGQKQRVCLARALIRKPNILLLDEATSALDANSEQAVAATLAEASKGRTTVTVAHRLSTVRHVDAIYVIDKGVVVEHGDHDQLVKKRGVYYQMLLQQNEA